MLSPQLAQRPIPTRHRGYASIGQPFAPDVRFLLGSEATTAIVPVMKATVKHAQVIRMTDLMLSVVTL